MRSPACRRPCRSCAKLGQLDDVAGTAVARKDPDAERTALAMLLCAYFREQLPGRGPQRRDVVCLCFVALPGFVQVRAEVDVGPARRHGFHPPAAGEQQQPDDVRLCWFGCAARAAVSRASSSPYR